MVAEIGVSCGAKQMDVVDVRVGADIRREFKAT
jgi:hypothetical protein